MEEAIIYRYLSGTATEEEQQQLLEWLESSPQNQAAFSEMKALWQVGRMWNKEYHTDRSLDQLNKRIDQMEGRKKARMRRLAVRVAAVAAVALLLVTVGVSYLFVGKNSLHVERPVYVFTNNAEKDTVKTIFLADGTTVWLGPHTTLTCPVTFDEDTRTVTLAGEAFFEVTKDAKHPFIVRTEANDIKVLGTSFSVCTRAAGAVCETVLMSGSVQLNKTSGEELAVLRPGQQALYSKENHSVEIHDVDASTLTSWRFGLVSLSEVSVAEIIRCLETTYNIRIEMDVTSLKGRIYNFSFKRTKGVQAALSQLSYITGVGAEVLP